uniref:Activin_recp domain-containing protein n=1 Tax=Caenorhabditis tropicalis TaxID=1561998 RepID=A0A1I7UIR5_9PELO
MRLFPLISIIFLVTGGINSLECHFSASSSVSQLNVHDGVDTCESSDVYCVTINNFNGISAKGCSMTARKLTFGVLTDRCVGSGGCNAEGTLCCCTGNKCNGSAGASILMTTILVFICFWSI